MSTCPELEYIYLFEKADIEAGNCIWSGGVAANKLITKKYGVNTEPPVEEYKSRPCLLKFIRIPLDLTDETKVSKEELQRLMFSDFFDYMKAHDYVLAGDAFALKIGFSKEDDMEWQYVLMHMPVDKA